MKIRFNPGGEEVGIVNQDLARALSVASGFRVRPFDDEGQAAEFVRSFMAGPSPGARGAGGSGGNDDWVKQMAQRLVTGDLVVISRTRSAPDFIHPRPIEASPLQVEEALRQRDPEPSPPPPSETPVETMVVKPEQLKTDAPLCEL